MDKEAAAAKIIDYVVTVTKPRWQEWIHQRYEDLDDMFITRGYEQGGFQVAIFYDILKSKGIGSIYHLGKILDGYQGERKYDREEKGGLEGKFYQDLKEGIYGEEGRKFYEAVRDFIAQPGANPGFKFWQLLWQMLVSCHYLKESYKGSFKYYLKKKFAEFRGVGTISDDEFVKMSLAEWNEFLKKTVPWEGLAGIGPNVFDYIIRDVDEFSFNQEAFKLDEANLHFFKVTGIGKLFNLEEKESIISFLKSLELSHKYSLKEINTGIYTYCSASERTRYGFCKDRRKCLECGVEAYCEKNIPGRALDYLLEAEGVAVERKGRTSPGGKTRAQARFLPQLVAAYCKLLGYKIDFLRKSMLVGHNDIGPIVVKYSMGWDVKRADWLKLIKEFEAAEKDLISQRPEFIWESLRRKRIFIISGWPESIPPSSKGDEFQFFCKWHEIELMSLNKFIERFIDKIDEKYPKGGKVSCDDDLIRLFIHLSWNNFLNKYWRRVS